jgi:predicted 2-oxoglutarate/Fe(II)-dependent dioxygenase YbiX
MSIIKSGHFGSSKKNIVVVKNFISTEHLNDFYSYAKTINDYKDSEGIWNNRVHTSVSFSKNNKYLFDLANNYLLQLKNEIEKQFKLKILEKQAAQIVIWRNGDFQLPHADKENRDGSEHPYPNNDIASLMYLNSDYKGGQIFFPNQKIQIKPEAGSAIFFPGDKYYLHGVSKITEGQRFTIPSFWQVKSASTSEDTDLES